MNILSHRASGEMMRRVANESLAMEVVGFLGVGDSMAGAYGEKHKSALEGLRVGEVFPIKRLVIAAVFLFVAILALTGLQPYMCFLDKLRVVLLSSIF